MSEDTNYEVGTELKLKGEREYAAGFRHAAGAAASLGTSLAKIKGGGLQIAAGAFGALERSVTTFGAAAAGAFTVAAYGAAKLGAVIGGNMSDLEGAAIQLGAVIGAATGRGFSKGRVAAQELFEEFQEMAIKSPAETQDFVNISKMITGPVVGATGSITKLRDMTEKVVGVASAVGETYEEAARDVNQILTGVAGNDVKMFRTLRAMGLIKEEAKSFNQLSQTTRFEKLWDAVGNKAFAEALEAQGNSWRGITSSISDVAKGFGRLAGGNIFGYVKGQLAALSTVMQDQVKGGKLADGFEHLGGAITFSLMNLRDALGELFPDAIGSAGSFVTVIEKIATGSIDTFTRAVRFAARHWDEIKASAEGAAAAITRAAHAGAGFVSAVGGGDFATGAARLGTAYVGVKGAEALGIPQMIGGGAMALSGLAGTANALGLFGGGAAAAGAAAGGAATGAGGAAAAGAGAAAAGAAGAAGAAAAVPLAMAALALEAVGLVAVALKQDSLGLASMFGLIWESLKQGFDELQAAIGPLFAGFKRLWNAAEPLVGIFGALLFHLSPIGIVVRLLGVALPILEVVLSKVAQAATWAVEGLAGIVDHLTAILGIKRKLAPIDAEEEDRREREQRAAIDYSRPNAGMVVSQDGRTLTSAAKSTEGKSPQKVEVTVKFDLGEPDRDAVYILTRKQIDRAINEANANPRISYVG